MIGIYIFPPAGPAFETGVPAVALGHLGHPQLVPQDAAAQGPPPLLSDVHFIVTDVGVRQSVSLTFSRKCCTN